MNTDERSLSVIIPSRNEEFLGETVEDILKNIRGNTNIIVVLDGQWPVKPLKDHPKVTILKYPESIGQRAATNRGVALTNAKYVLKCDAHCSFDEGFDVKMMDAFERVGGNVVMVPVMRNLHAFDWVCENGHRRYQGPSGPCQECGKETHKEIMWIGKHNPQSTSYCFDSEPHFQYFNEYKNEQKKQGDLVETMSLQGSCFMVTREKYWELDICNEDFGSWGSQGIEVAVKFWLSGGRVLVNKNTWYAHMFRTQGKDFGFPYPISGKQVSHAKKMSRDLFFENNWDKQVRPLSWLLEKFWPVRGWNDDQLKEMQTKGEEFYKKKGIASEKIVPIVDNSISSPADVFKDYTFAPALPNPTVGILYYTNNKAPEHLMRAAQKTILEGAKGKRIVSVSLLPIDFGENIVMEGYESGPLTMFEQILTGLQELDTDVVFFTECDVLYHPSHFDFVPKRRDLYYYNNNVWQVRCEDKFAVRFDCQRLSQLCAYRETLIRHYQERIRRCKEEGFSRKMGFEPGTHGRSERVDDLKYERWESKEPSCDLRHDKNMTASRWKPEEFRSQRSCQNWVNGRIPEWAKNLI